MTGPPRVCLERMGHAREPSRYRPVTGRIRRRPSSSRSLLFFFFSFPFDGFQAKRRKPASVDYFGRFFFSEKGERGPSFRDLLRRCVKIGTEYYPFACRANCGGPRRDDGGVLVETQTSIVGTENCRVDGSDIRERKISNAETETLRATELSRAGDGKLHIQFG